MLAVWAPKITLLRKVRPLSVTGEDSFGKLADMGFSHILRMEADRRQPPAPAVGRAPMVWPGRLMPRKLLRSAGCGLFTCFKFHHV